MTNNFIKKQLNFIVTNANIVDIYEIDKIRYGLEVIYGESSKMIIVLLVSLLLNKFSAALTILTLLVLIRPHIGGSHAKNYLSCLIQSNILFIIVYYLAYFLPPINIYFQLLVIISLIFSANKFKPVNPLRKKINTSYKNIKFKDIVTITVLVWFFISNIFLSTYLTNCGILIIFYILVDFLKEVYFHEKTK